MSQKKYLKYFKDYNENCRLCNFRKFQLSQSNSNLDTLTDFCEKCGHKTIFTNKIFVVIFLNLNYNT